jgi:hypothetical protein
MHLAYSVGNAPVRHFPFPHIYVENVFPDDFYRRLREHLPPKKNFTTLKALKRVSGDYPETRFVLPLEPDLIAGIDEPFRSFWHDTAAWLLGGQFAALVLSKFGTYLDERFGDARDKEFMNEAMLVQDYSTYSLAPHTDTPAKVLSFLFYLPEDAALAHLGTSIYLPKDRRHVSDGTDHHRPEFFDRLVTMPFVPNALFAFLKTPNAFHGVEPVVERDVRRDLLLYDIKVQGEIAPLATPSAQAGTNVQFSF